MAVFTHEELIALLEELVTDLVTSGVGEVDIRVVGGAAIALVHDVGRDAAQDVDCTGSTTERRSRPRPASWPNAARFRPIG